MSDYPELLCDSFTNFYRALYHCNPFRWQVRLAERACRNEWPRFIKLPTSSGKTSCLDIAVFALAYQACRLHSGKQAIDTPRRIFFVVDRRIIVNEAYQRGNKLAAKLNTAVKEPVSPLYSVAWWLRNLAGNEVAPPLDCYELRGGIYRDDAWVRSLLQPTIVTCTVDQIGSRLLFRGYGVSDGNLPIHAALTANDSLILLDEAHCSNPFSQTITSIARYRDAGLEADAAGRWAQHPIRTPFGFVQMTATPPQAVEETDVFHLEEADYQTDELLEERHGCAKPIRLEESNAKGGKQNLTLARHLVDQAESLARETSDQPRCQRIAIVVNRVACARYVFELLRIKYGKRVELMIGRMRPIDRDRLTAALQDRFRSGSDEQLTEPHFVVATQCLEVGADLDFDGMICQCASMDALRQRFGRLNRLGQTPHARGVIVMAEGDRAPRKPDPIYGESLPATWEWLKLQSSNNTIDFGVRWLDDVLAKSRAADADAVDRLTVVPIDAPVLMPAHLDLLCQTSPRPALEPDVSSYLHGPNRGIPEIRICWRADLPVYRQGRDKEWEAACSHTLAICPPSSAECLSVPLPQLKSWLLGEETNHFEDFGDLLGEELDGDDEMVGGTKARKNPPPHRRGVTWNGRECRAVSGDSEEMSVIRPQCLVVLPATAGGWSSLGYVPDAPAEPKTAADKDELCERSAGEMHNLARIDEATTAFKQSRNRFILRVHPGLVTSAADHAAFQGLWEFIDDEERIWRHDMLAVGEAGVTTESLSDSNEESDLARASSHIDTRLNLARCSPREVQILRYPGGFVVVGPKMPRRTQLPRPSFGDDFDEHNIDADDRISLADHLADVAAETQRLATTLEMDASLVDSLVAAAERHDLGKADPRFQAMLLGSSLNIAAMQPRLWAKSNRGTLICRNLSELSVGKMVADQLPAGFRHEMLSLELVRHFHHSLDAESHELMLHTIAAHHGHSRPFAPVVIDDLSPDLELGRLYSPAVEELNVTSTSEHRSRLPAHRLDSGISERFWKLNRRFGWWGLAWLETVLRLADWVASAQPSSAPSKPLIHKPAASDLPLAAEQGRLKCMGLNGANPLGFLAALGLFRHLTTLPNSEIRMQWDLEGGNWSPTLIGSHPVLLDQSAFLDWLCTSLKVEPGQHPLIRLNEIPDGLLRISRPSEYSRAVEGARWDNRITADWLSCNGSDLCEVGNNNQLQTARRDYFPESAEAIINALTRDHLERTLFRQWDYADPIQKVSLHLEPREDRRHAYQWHKPVGDPNRALQGGMVGANRLAMEAWPFFQSVAVRGELQTVGFQGTRPMKGISWTWPLWGVPIAPCDVTPLLNLDGLKSKSDHSSDGDYRAVRERGIPVLFRSRRILVEKTPNLTPAIAVFASSF